MNHRRLLRVHFPLLLALLFTGCKSKCDLVEAELRTKNSEVRNLRAQLHSAEAYNAAIERDFHAVMQSGPAPLVVDSGQIAPLKEVVLGRGTGGYDDDNCPGDEGLEVVVQPNDFDGHTIKAPGFVHITAIEISPEGLKRPFSTWDVPPQQLRKTWRSGLLSTGYFIVLPWTTWPTTCKIRVVAQFKVPDGRIFEADKDVTVHLPPTTLPTPGPGGPIKPVMPPVTDVQPVPPPPQPVDSGPAMPEATARAPQQQHITAWRPVTPAAQLLRPVPMR